MDDVIQVYAASIFVQGHHVDTIVVNATSLDSARMQIGFIRRNTKGLKRSGRPVVLLYQVWERQQRDLHQMLQDLGLVA